MVDYDGLIEALQRTEEPLGLLTMQATGTTGLLMKAMPGRIVSLFEAEGGFFGSGERSASTWHPFWNRPIHGLCLSKLRITDEMLSGIGRLVIDLCDIGVRCHPFLATLKEALEACAARRLPVTVLDRPIPLGGILDGPMRRPSYESSLAPLNVPFCHGMTPGECATWLRATHLTDLDLDVVRLRDWRHDDRAPWANFVATSADLASWDSAVFYPMTVFTQAYPAVDCGLGTALAHRVIGAPWLDAKALSSDLAPGLSSCGIAMRPYRYVAQAGSYRGMSLNGLLFSVPNPSVFYPVTAGVLLLTALLQHHGTQTLVGAKPERLDRLFGSSEIRDTLAHGELGELFQAWIDAQDAFLPTRADLYAD